MLPKEKEMEVLEAFDLTIRRGAEPVSARTDVEALDDALRCA